MWVTMFGASFLDRVPEPKTTTIFAGSGAGRSPSLVEDRFIGKLDYRRLRIAAWKCSHRSSRKNSPQPIAQALHRAVYMRTFFLPMILSSHKAGERASSTSCKNCGPFRLRVARSRNESAKNMVTHTLRVRVRHLLNLGGTVRKVQLATSIACFFEQRGVFCNARIEPRVWRHRAKCRDESSRLKRAATTLPMLPCLPNSATNLPPARRARATPARRGPPPGIQCKCRV